MLKTEPFNSHSFLQKPMAAQQLSLTLLVDKETNRVIFAESGKDFVETLFSLLTMPLGTVIKLSGKQTNMGSLTMLYQSLEDLDLELLSTESCKDMLLHPKSSAEELCKNLNLMGNIGASNPTQYYICSSWKCCTEEHYLVSTVKKTKCRCGKTMKWFINEKKEDFDVEGGGGFIQGKMRFMMTDDLQVSVVSSSTVFNVLRERGIDDASVLEEINVNVGEEEVLHLLKRLLLSKTPLTDVFCGEPEPNSVDEVDLDLKVLALDSNELVQSQADKEIGSESRKMIVKLFLSKSNNKVLYAESGEEFADLLFNFLAFPLGTIVKCLSGCTSMGCLDNLYKSVEAISFMVKSEECKAMLLDPKLAPYFGTMNQLLQIEEQVPCEPNIFYCETCYDDNKAYITAPRTCSHGKKSIQLSTMNQKFPDAVTELGGAFIAGPAMFMVTDELIVKPLSPISSISLLSKFNVPISDIEERIVCIGVKEAMSLLKASLTSNSVLSNVFYSKKPKQMKTKHKKRIPQRRHLSEA